MLCWKCALLKHESLLHLHLDGIPIMFLGFPIATKIFIYVNMWIDTHYTYITITQFSVILKICASHAKKAPLHVTMETPSENEDISIPRYGWEGWFCYRYEEEYSQRDLEVSRLNQAMRGETEGKWERKRRERRGEKASRLRERTHEEQRGQRKSPHSVWLKGLSYIVIQSRRKQSPVPELERFRLRVGREGLGRHTGTEWDLSQVSLGSNRHSGEFNIYCWVNIRDRTTIYGSPMPASTLRGQKFHSHFFPQTT